MSKGYQIPGLPEGYEAVEVRRPNKGEEYLSHTGDIDIAGTNFDAKKLIIRPVFDYSAFWSSLSFLPAGTWIAKKGNYNWFAFSQKPKWDGHTWYPIINGELFRLDLWPFNNIQFPDLAPADSLLQTPEAE